MNRIPICALLASVVTFLSDAALADVKMIVWGRPQMRDEVVSLVAKRAAADRIDVSVGQDISQIIVDRCGHLSKPYRNAVLSANNNIRGKIDNDFKAVESIKGFILPACLYTTTKPFSYVTKPHDTLETIAAKFTGFRGPRTMRLFQQVNRPMRMKPFRAGQTISVPYLAKATQLSFESSESQASFENELRALDDYYYRATRLPRIAKSGAQTLICPMMPLTVEKVDCENSSPNYPMNYPEVATVLKLNHWIRQRRGFTGAPGTVIVVDTGIFGFQNADFSGPIGRGIPNTFDEKDLNLVRSSEDATARTFGGSLSDSSMDPSPSEKSLYKSHGTHIAGIIVGAAIPTSVRELTKGHINLSVYNAEAKSSSCGDNVSLSPGLVKLFLNAVDNLVPQPPTRIINLSLWSNVEITVPFSKLLNNSLLVASSGNKPIDFRTDRTKIWLAHLGLRRQPNLLVVAAHGSNGKIVPETAFGVNKVDLAAPGCKIRSIVGADRSEQAEFSGTSQAAAFVSFAAGLLNGFYALSPTSIADRLLLTVDQTQELKDKVRSGGSLNVAKALAYNFDIVERSNPAGGISRSYGIIWNEQVVPCDTDADPLPVSIRDVGKLKLDPAEDGKTSVLIEGPDRSNLFARDCKIGRNSRLTYSEYLAPGRMGPKHLINLSEVRSINPTPNGESRVWQQRCVARQGEYVPPAGC